MTARVTVTQYLAQAVDGLGATIQAPEEPYIASQTIELGTGRAEFAALSDKCGFVLLTGEARFSYVVGIGTTAVPPTRLATLADAVLPAGAPYFFGVRRAAERVVIISAIANP